MKTRRAFVWFSLQAVFLVQEVFFLFTFCWHFNSYYIASFSHFPQNISGTEDNFLDHFAISPYLKGKKTCT